MHRTQAPERQIGAIQIEHRPGELRCDPDPGQSAYHEVDDRHDGEPAYNVEVVLLFESSFHIPSPR